MRRLIPLAAVLLLVTAACTTVAEETTTTTAPATTATTIPATTATTTDTPEPPPTAPSEIVFGAQDSDGASIVVASVTLPAPGFIAVHGNADGSPGQVIGHSELLAAGTSTDVTVTLDQPLIATDLVFPMVHIDMDSDGAYTFEPPDNIVDIPGQTAEGQVAVVGAEVTVGG